MREVRDCNTIEFFPNEIAFPQVSLTDYLKQAASDMASILTKSLFSTVLLLQEGDLVRNVLL